MLFWMECINPATICFVLQYPCCLQNSGSLELFGVVFCLQLEHWRKLVQCLILLWWGRGVPHVALGADSCFCLFYLKVPLLEATVTTAKGTCPMPIERSEAISVKHGGQFIAMKVLFRMYFTGLQHISAAMLIAMVCNSHSPDRTGHRPKVLRVVVRMLRRMYLRAFLRKHGFKNEHTVRRGDLSRKKCRHFRCAVLVVLDPIYNPCMAKKTPASGGSSNRLMNDE